MFVAVFLHMIIVGDKASWLKGVPRFINTDFFLNGFGIFFFPLLFLTFSPLQLQEMFYVGMQWACAQLYLSNLYKQSPLQQGYRWLLVDSESEPLIYRLPDSKYTQGMLILQSSCPPQDRIDIKKFSRYIRQLLFYPYYTFYSLVHFGPSPYLKGSG